MLIDILEEVAPDPPLEFFSFHGRNLYILAIPDAEIPELRSPG